MKYKFLLIIFIISLISSIILFSISKGDSGFCKPDSGCNEVQNSKYASLFGISNSVYGVFIFAFLSIMTFIEILNPTQTKRILIDSMAIIGFFVAFYFIFLQIFIIEAFCKYCIIIDSGMILSSALIVEKEMQTKK